MRPFYLSLPHLTSSHFTFCATNLPYLLWDQTRFYIRGTYPVHIPSISRTLAPHLTSPHFLTSPYELPNLTTLTPKRSSFSSGIIDLKARTTLAMLGKHIVIAMSCDAIVASCLSRKNIIEMMATTMMMIAHYNDHHECNDNLLLFGWWICLNMIASAQRAQGPSLFSQANHPACTVACNVVETTSAS